MCIMTFTALRSCIKQLCHTRKFERNQTPETFSWKKPNGVLWMEWNSMTCNEEFFMLHTSMLLPLIEKKNWNSSSGEDTSSRWLPSCSTSMPPTSGITSLSCWPSSSSVGSKYPSHACNTKKNFPTSTNPKTHLTIQILSFLATMNTLRWQILLQQSEFPTLQPWRPLFAYSNTHPGILSKDLSATESAFSRKKLLASWQTSKPWNSSKTSQEKTSHSQ